MTTIKDTPLLKFKPNSVEEIRKELNLHHEGAMEEMINSFEDWIRKQNHFTKTDFDRHYLETSIILAKGSLEKAKKTLDTLCSLKTLQPQFFTKFDANKEISDYTGFIIQATMPNLLENNYRLYAIKVTSSDLEPAKVLDFHRFSILMSEYVKRHDYCLGFTCVVDCRNINLINFVTKINVLDLRNCMTVLMEGYCLRINAIHILSSSKAVDALVTLLKQVLSAKVASRITVHKTVESLLEQVPKEALPEDLGGTEKPIKEIQQNWFNVLSTEENVAFIKEMLKARTNEKYRLVDRYNDQILGMPGSFRSLTVD